MTVHRYRNIEDVPATSAGQFTATENVRSAVEVSDLALQLRPIAIPRGVARFHSIEDANEHRRRWESLGISK